MHDVGDDPRLSSVPAVPIEEPPVQIPENQQSRKKSGDSPDPPTKRKSVDSNEEEVADNSVSIVTKIENVLFLCALQSS